MIHHLAIFNKLNWSMRGSSFQQIKLSRSFRKYRTLRTGGEGGGGGGGGGYLPYILLNEIQTMFSQLAKRSARVLPADLCTDHAHYVKNHRSTVSRKNKNMAVEGGTISRYPISHYYILVIRKFIDFMSLFRHSVWFYFSVKQFLFAEVGICNT